jgi:membrane protease YdiL (CAAX protease family)
VLSWALWIPAALVAAGWWHIPLSVTLAGLLGAWMPSLVAILLAGLADGRAGLRLLWRRLTLWRVGGRWYLFALLWPAANSLLATTTATLLGWPAPDFANPPVVSVYPVPPEALAAGFLPLLPMVFVIQFFGSSLGEEIGWRGFALPRLQARWGWLASSLVLGLLWAGWQVPHEWVPGQPVNIAAMVWLVVGMVLSAALYTWLFNHTRGSLLPVLLFHTSQAVTGLFLAGVGLPWLESAWAALLLGLILAVEAQTSGRAHLAALPG